MQIDEQAGSLFVWLVTNGWCWFVLREKYCWPIASGWFVPREKGVLLVADKPARNLPERAREVNREQQIFPTTNSP
jgi:hypothetical protein